jgi:hypothetical protein
MRDGVATALGFRHRPGRRDRDATCQNWSRTHRADTTARRVSANARDVENPASDLKSELAGEVNYGDVGDEPHVETDTRDIRYPRASTVNL